MNGEKYMYDEMERCYIDEDGIKYYPQSSIVDLHKIYHYGEIDKFDDGNYMERKYQKHKEICNRLNELYVSKNKEYGDSFGKAYGRRGALSAVIQLEHKMERLSNIVGNDNIKYESLEDTVADLANYAIMLLTEIELDKGEY